MSRSAAVVTRLLDPRLAGRGRGRDGAGTLLDGPGAGERLVSRACERYGIWLRTAVVCLCSALGIASAGPGADIALALALLVPAALACGVRLHALQRRSPRASMAVLDAAAVVLAALSQPVLGGANADVMVAAIVGISVITFQYEWATRPVVGALLTAVSVGACALGDVLSSPGRTVEVLPLARLVFESGLSRVGYLIVRSRARAADRATARSAEIQRTAAAATARRAAEREFLATLHDTACATLLVVSQGPRERQGPHDQDWSWLPLRATKDLEALSAVPGSGSGTVDLAPLLATVADEPQGDGALRLRTRIDGPLPVPAGVALATLGGVREAATNVFRHAGVQEAEIRAWAHESGVVVELTDQGKGFAVAAVPARRRGISDSIVGRMRAVGGLASVVSRPGAGTRAHWHWNDQAGASPGDDGARDAPEDAAPSRAGFATGVRLVRGQIRFAAQLGTLLTAVLAQFTLSLQMLIAHQEVFRPAWAQTLAFCCLAVVAVVGAAYLLRGRQIPKGVRSWCLGVVLAVSATSAFTLPPERIAGAGDWGFGLVGWHALFLLVGQPVRAYAAFWGAHIGINAIAVLLAGAPSVSALAAMGIAVVSIGGFQLSVAMMARLLHNSALDAAAEAAHAADLRTRERIGEAMQRDHKERYDALAATTVPLLVGLGQGVLSPSDEDVRLRCGIEVARMRRLFAEGDAVADLLLNELRACVEVAELRGVQVNLAARGEPGEVPTAIRRQLVDPVAVAMGLTRTAARVTLSWTARAVRVSIVCEDRADVQGEWGDADMPDRANEVTVTRTTSDSRLLVQASWPRPAGPAVAEA
jgi:hypothetical protein